MLIINIYQDSQAFHLILLCFSRFICISHIFLIPSKSQTSLFFSDNLSKKKTQVSSKNWINVINYWHLSWFTSCWFNFIFDSDSVLICFNMVLIEVSRFFCWKRIDLNILPKHQRSAIKSLNFISSISHVWPSTLYVNNLITCLKGTVQINIWFSFFSVEHIR